PRAREHDASWGVVAAHRASHSLRRAPSVFSAHHLPAHHPSRAPTRGPADARQHACFLPSAPRTRRKRGRSKGMRASDTAGLDAKRLRGRRVRAVPLLRLLAYYAALVVLGLVLLWLFPEARQAIAAPLTQADVGVTGRDSALRLSSVRAGGCSWRPLRESAPCCSRCPWPGFTCSRAGCATTRRSCRRSSCCRSWSPASSWW